MKQLLYLILPIFSLLMSSCADDSQTIANVKEAAIIAHNETIYYNFFAKQAAKDSLPNIQKLFSTLSKSAEVQSKLLSKELAKLGVNKFQAPSYQQTIDSTLSNLYKSHTSNQYDFYNLFPLFVEQAQQENKPSAVKLFNQIIIAKEANILLLDNSIKLLLNKTLVDTSYSLINVVVCPKCGYISQTDVCKACN